MKLPNMGKMTDCALAFPKFVTFLRLLYLGTLLSVLIILIWKCSSSCNYLTKRLCSYKLYSLSHKGCLQPLKIKIWKLSIRTSVLIPCLVWQLQTLKQILDHLGYQDGIIPLCEINCSFLVRHTFPVCNFNVFVLFPRLTLVNKLWLCSLFYWDSLSQ